MSLRAGFQARVPLAPYTSLRAGGKAASLAEAHTADELAELVSATHVTPDTTTVLGMGSNVLPSDDGVPGFTIINRAARISVSRSGEVVAESGCSFQELFLKAAQSSLRGLEFAVGIPGTLGGALVSNAGAYRSCVSEFLTGIEIVLNGQRTWVAPSWMEFSYRDSILRRVPAPKVAILKVAMKLPVGSPKAIYDEAREYQRQRIGKQPPPASAGSFFKNVNDRDLAERLESLPDSLKTAGVVPAGYLIESVGLKGYRFEGAMFGRRHANFILNVGAASASDIRRLANIARYKVRETHGVELEEEVLYLGDWAEFLKWN